MKKFLFPADSVIGNNRLRYIRSNGTGRRKRLFSYGRNKTDYHFKILEKDNNGNTADKYYKFNFHPEKFTAAPEISWRNPDSEPQDQTNLLTIRMPQDKIIIFSTLTPPKTGLTVYNTPQTKLVAMLPPILPPAVPKTTVAPVTNAAFQTIGTLTGNFINNHSDFGGAIYNQGDIGPIYGDFIGNNTQTHVPYPDVSDVKSNS